MVIFPNAKINIGLFVTEKRSDGFHNLETVFYPIDLRDILEITEVKGEQGRCVFTSTGILIDCPPEKNLVSKAYAILAAEYDLPSVDVHLHKIIPYGAGLGGGSSDAAFMLVGLNQLFSLGLNEEQLMGYAARVGSDCPFFVLNHPVFAFGKGELMETIDLSLKDYHMVLVKPNRGVSTPEAYRGITPRAASFDLRELGKLPVEQWSGVIVNDFEDSDDDEGRQLAVTLYYHAMAFLRENRELTLLTDLYSTAYELRYQPLQLTLCTLYDHTVRRQTVREVLEVGVEAETLLYLYADCGAVSVSREGETTLLRTAVTVRALYLDEGGACLSAERCIDVNCPVELPRDCTVTARAVCAEEVQGTLGERGIEVRFPLDFHVEAFCRCQRSCIASAELDESTPKNLNGAPSLILRCVGKQESAWEVAKRYNTTIGDILSANRLEKEADIPCERLLLIPRKRT